MSARLSGGFIDKMRHGAVLDAAELAKQGEIVAAFALEVNATVRIGSVREDEAPCAPQGPGQRRR